jgi:guanyl-specific ribonuclease Sa
MSRALRILLIALAVFTLFQNREHRLPGRPGGYYREYTVPTPGSDDRGARRIVAGGDPPEIYYYTDDHYRSFRHVEIDR